jgi:hypothetical protein
MQWIIDWWRNQTKATIYNDIHRWANIAGETQRKAFYGENRDNWPVDCTQYNG